MVTGHELLAALPIAIYTTDAEGRITYFNDAAVALWGHRPELGSDRWCGSWRLFWPDGRPMSHDQCPMAVTLREGRPVRGVEAVAERPDGTRVPFMPFPTALLDDTGRVIGAINMLMDLTERNQAELDSAKLASVVLSSNDAVITKTLTGQVVSWNAAATRMFGYQPAEMIGQSITRIIPPELQGEETEILARIGRGERIQHYETVRVAKDGRSVDISLSVSPVRDRAGRLVGAAKVARDITERKRTEKLQRLLVEELNHRVKNTLATVLAIATHSLRHAKSQADFEPGFTGRIQALARAHDLLTLNSWRGADMREIVRDQVLLGATTDDRVSCAGPSLTLDRSSALHLSLVLHELGTNARKYGALSVPSGRLSVSWRMRTNDGSAALLEWKESNGPKVNAPAARGFGTTLIEETLRAHGGEAVLHYSADGFTCDIRLPLSEGVDQFDELGTAARQLGAEVSTLDPQAGRPAGTLAGKRILIVEDEPLLSMDMEAALAEAGCEIIGPVATLDGANQLIADHDFDAALVDVNLAGEPVDDIAIALTRRSVPFAFATGHGRDALPQGFREAVLVRKPFAPNQLRAAVAKLFHERADVIQLKRKSV